MHHWGQRGAATSPSHFQTITSVPVPQAELLCRCEARLSLPPFRQGVCAPSPETPRAGLPPFPNAGPHPHPWRAHCSPRGLQGPLSASSCSAAPQANFGGSGHGQTLFPTLPRGPPSPSVPCVTRWLSPLHSAAWLALSTNSPGHRITPSLDPMVGFQALILLGFLTASGTTAQSPSVPTVAPRMRLPPCPLLLRILSPCRLTLLCLCPH